jgi:magnesium chelatase accessory protein
VQVTGTGQDVLLLHGAGASAHTWHRLMPYLDDRYRLIAPDLPGHGFTQSPKGRSEPAAGRAGRRGAHGNMEAAPRIVIGHSAGGAVALEIARQGLLDLDRIVVINGALEDFRGPAGRRLSDHGAVMAMNPLTGLFLSRGSSEAQVRSLIGATGSDLDADGLALYARLIARRSHVDGTLAMMAQWSLRSWARRCPASMCRRCSCMARTIRPSRCQWPNAPRVRCRMPG